LTLLYYGPQRSVLDYILNTITTGPEAPEVGTVGTHGIRYKSNHAKVMLIMGMEVCM